MPYSPKAALRSSIVKTVRERSLDPAPEALAAAAAAAAETFAPDAPAFARPLGPAFVRSRA